MCAAPGDTDKMVNRYTYITLLLHLVMKDLAIVQVTQPATLPQTKGSQHLLTVLRGERNTGVLKESYNRPLIFYKRSKSISNLHNFH